MINTRDDRNVQDAACPNVVTIGRVTLRRVTKYSVEHVNIVPSKKTEAGYEVSDNCARQPLEFSLSGYVDFTLGEHAILRKCADDFTPTSLSTRYNYYDNVLITKLSVDDGESSNMIQVNLSLRQIAISQAQTAMMNFPVNGLLPATGGADTGEVAKPGEKVVENPPPKSILDGGVASLKGFVVKDTTNANDVVIPNTNGIIKDGST